MSDWNYRIVNYLDGFVLREVFYDENMKPTKHGSAGMGSVVYDSPFEVKEALELMLQALDRPVLSEKEIGAKP